MWQPEDLGRLECAECGQRFMVSSPGEIDHDAWTFYGAQWNHICRPGGKAGIGIFRYPEGVYFGRPDELEYPNGMEAPRVPMPPVLPPDTKPSLPSIPNPPPPPPKRTGPRPLGGPPVSRAEFERLKTQKEAGTLAPEDQPPTARRLPHLAISVTREFAFCYGHHLPAYAGPCARFHGHNSTLAVEFNRSAKPQDHKPYPRMVLDFRAIKDVVGPIVNEIDHRNLNDIGFSHPTAEALVAFFVAKIQATDLGPGLMRVRVSETPTSWAEWNGRRSY